MNELSFNRTVLAASGGPMHPQKPGNTHAMWWRAATQLFWRSYSRGQASRFWSRLRRQSRSLYDLNRLGCTAANQHYAGLKTVSLDRIGGSEGRCHDFDRDFSPTSFRTHDRWIRVAVAVLQGSPLPAIQLIQVGDMYFVRDGHHRVSVARAWGQDFIDAEVTVWDVPHPLPWEQPAPVASSRLNLGRVLAL